MVTGLRLTKHCSFSPAKPSRPSRAYIHVVASEHIGPLSDRVRQSSFLDASHTSNDPVLLGPPALEFAPYAKAPGSRVRKDARQGTIDQDPEFIAFLESLTQPITKPATVDSLEPDEKKASVVTTPLVQYIKDKKASKAKETAASKSAKRSEKESKQEKVQAKKLLQRPDKKLASGPSSEEKPKGEKASKESSKAARQAASGISTKGGKPSSSSTTKENASAAASERKRERGSVAAAAKILQRDLGLAPSSGRRRGKGSVNDTGSTKNENSRESSVPATEGSKRDAPSKPGKSAASSTKTKDRDGESPSGRQSSSATPPVNATTTTPSTKPAKGAKLKVTAGPTPTATQAFLKHANASQGVTEALLEAAFAPFGTVTKVEIDKKKGFGYVDFAEPEGLQKAMVASPVSVAQSQVVVLERKANPGGEKARKGGGGGGGGGSGGRGETAQQAKGDKPKVNEEKGAAGGGAGGSSRGSRGGRGSRNKGKGGDGSKGGPSSGPAAAPTEKSGSSDAK